jgi:hypothetical protein
VSGELAGGVVVASNEQGLDAGFAQLGHLRGEEQAGIVILPVAVLQVTGEQHEGDLLRNGQFNEVFQGPPASAADRLDWAAIILFQASEWTIEVDICSMDELEHSCLPGPALSSERFPNPSLNAAIFAFNS